MRYTVAHLCPLSGDGPIPKKPGLPFFSLIATLDPHTGPAQLTNTLLSCLEISPKMKSLDQIEKLLEDSAILWLN